MRAVGLVGGIGHATAFPGADGVDGIISIMALTNSAAVSALMALPYPRSRMLRLARAALTALFPKQPSEESSGPTRWGMLGASGNARDSTRRDFPSRQGMRSNLAQAPSCTSSPTRFASPDPCASCKPEASHPACFRPSPSVFPIPPASPAGSMEFPCPAASAA